MGQVTGVAPGFLLMPAREYKWQLENKVEIRIPVKGSIAELTKQGEKLKFAGDPEFSIFEDNVLLLWEVVRVLFAKSNYPALEDDQCLNVVALEFEGDDVIIYGEVIKNIG